jgi:hypothetical protein
VEKDRRCEGNVHVGRFVSTILLALVILGTAFGLLLLSQSPAHAATFCVNGTSINAALAGAQPGNTIRVAAGTYTEYVTINKTVTLLVGWNAGCTVRDLATVVDVTLSNALFSDVAAGDLDRDNRPDLIISTAADVDTHPNKFKDAGKVFVIYGGPGLGAVPPLQHLHLPLILKNH